MDIMTQHEFHHNNWTNSDGTCMRFRRNGQTKTWKRDRNRFVIPVKHGLYDYGHITEANVDLFHTPGDDTCARICANRGVAVVAW